MPRRVVVAVDGDTPAAVALLAWVVRNVSVVSAAVAAGDTAAPPVAAAAAPADAADDAAGGAGDRPGAPAEAPATEAPPAAAAAPGDVLVTILHATLPPTLPLWGPDPMFTSDALVAEILAEDRRRAVAAAVALRGHAARLHLPAEVVTRPGDPRDVVADYVAAARAELLVVGSRGLGGLSKLFLGSVSSHLVAHAACPVVVYRPAKGDDA